MTVQSSINALRSKQDIPNSIDPNYHADLLQNICDSLQVEFNGGTLPPIFSSVDTYLEGEYVIRPSEKLMYRAKEDVGAGLFNSSDWDIVGLKPIMDRLLELSAKVSTPVSYRASWLADSNPPQYQLCLSDNVGQTVQFNTVALADLNNAVTLAEGLGEFTFNSSLDHITLSINLQVIRRKGGASPTYWGIYFEISEDGITWSSVEGSTRYLSLSKEAEDEVRNASYSVRVSSIVSGTKLRVMQITEDTSLEVGIISNKPWSNLPAAAGAIFSIGT